MTSDPPDVMLHLKEKEATVLCLLARGYTVEDMVGELHFSDDYVYTLIRSLKQRFHAKTVAAIVSRAIAGGIISPDGVLLRQQRGNHENSAD